MIYLIHWLWVSTALFFLLYTLGVQYKRGGWWNVCRAPAVLALLIDVPANYTTWAVIFWELPRHKEYTLTKRLGRLRYDFGWRGAVARYITRVIDAIEPDGSHV